MAKLMFQWVYWHVLLPGREIPGTAERSTTMTTLATVDVDAEGFLRDPEQWTEALAAEIAREAGIDPLTDRHMQVVRFMRDTYLATGTAPTIRTLGKASGVPDQGALPALPQGPGEAGREDRRHPQAPRLHLGAVPCPRSRRSPSSSPAARWRASTPG